VTVKLTPVTEKHLLFGYKQVPDGGADGGTDGGAPVVAGPVGPYRPDAGAPPVMLGPALPPNR
jgi:hypothetical protein